MLLILSVPNGTSKYFFVLLVREKKGLENIAIRYSEYYMYHIL